MQSRQSGGGAFLGSVTELTQAEIRRLPDLEQRVIASRVRFNAAQSAFGVDRIRKRNIGKEPNPAFFREYWAADEEHDK